MLNEKKAELNFLHDLVVIITLFSYNSIRNYVLFRLIRIFELPGNNINNHPGKFDF